MYWLPLTSEFPIYIIRIYLFLPNIFVGYMLWNSKEFNNFPNASGVAWIWIGISPILEFGLPTNSHKSDTIIVQEKERETSQ